MTEPRIVGRMSRADRALLDDMLHEAREGRLELRVGAQEAELHAFRIFIGAVANDSTFTARKSPAGRRLHWERRHLYGWVSLRLLAQAVGSIPQEAA